MKKKMIFYVFGIFLVLGVSFYFYASFNDGDTKEASLQENTQKNTQSKYNINNPISDVELKNFLSFMDEFHKELESKSTDNTISETDWLKFLADNNKKGWEVYDNANYTSDKNKESEEQFYKRNDVLTAWMSLTDLDMKIKKTNDISQYENRFQTDYNKAVSNFK